jgi:hypothetical protein
MIKIQAVVLILALSLLSQGCLAAAVGYAGYALSSSKEEAAKTDADARHLQTYNAYKADSDKLNFEREKSGLKSKPVMTFAEWKLAHNIPTPAPEPKPEIKE